MSKRLIKRKEAFPLNYHNFNVVNNKTGKSNKMEDTFSVNVPNIQNEKTFYLFLYKRICN